MPARSLESAKYVSEKILQRYVFEKLSESAASARTLLPRRLHSKAAQLRVLIPEYDLTNPTHRADFRLIFRDRTWQNIEVEWTTSRFVHPQEAVEAHYADGRGFLLTLEDDRDRARSYVKSLDVVEIDPREFSWWFSKNARKLLDATIAVHTEAYAVRQRKHWVIYVGKQGGAESDYLERGRPKGIWAFRYTRGENLANILSIIEGDVAIFATKWRTPGGRQIYAGGNWSCSHLDIFEVTNGYWCDFKDRTFEKTSWSGASEEKEYMHYFRFSNAAKRELLYKTTDRIDLTGTDFKSDPLHVRICDALRKSNTQAGAPVQLDEEAVESLRQVLVSKTP